MCHWLCWGGVEWGGEDMLGREAAWSKPVTPGTVLNSCPPGHMGRGWQHKSACPLPQGFLGGRI